jgi:hypothetical protein
MTTTRGRLLWVWGVVCRGIYYNSMMLPIMGEDHGNLFRENSRIIEMQLFIVC